MNRVQAKHDAMVQAEDRYMQALHECYGKAAVQARIDERGRAGHLDKLYCEYHIARRNYLEARRWEMITGERL